MTKDKLRRAFGDLVHEKPCFVCGKRGGIEMAHFRPPSRWATGEYPAVEWGHRTHKGDGWFFAVPLCKDHHRLVHSMGEPKFLKWLDDASEGASARLYAHMLRLVLEAFDETSEGGGS